MKYLLVALLAWTFYTAMKVDATTGRYLGHNREYEALTFVECERMRQWVEKRKKDGFGVWSDIAYISECAPKPEPLWPPR